MNPIRWFESAGASSELVSLDRFVHPCIFATQSGAYGGGFRIRGVDPECLSDAELANISSRVVQAMRPLPEDCSLYQIFIKRRGCHLPPSRYVDSANEAVAETQRKRRAYLTARRSAGLSCIGRFVFIRPKLENSPNPVNKLA